MLIQPLSMFRPTNESAGKQTQKKKSIWGVLIPFIEHLEQSISYMSCRLSASQNQTDSTKPFWLFAFSDDSYTNNG